jgi:hypothetical protein
MRSPTSSTSASFLAGPSFAESGAAREVEAVLWRTNAIESFDTGVVRAVTEAGVRLWFGASHACAANREPEIVVEGERGRAVWRHERDCVLECDGRGVHRRPLPLTSETRRSMMTEVVATGCTAPRRSSAGRTWPCTTPP